MEIQPLQSANMGWPNCLQWVFFRDSLSLGLNWKATLSGQLCSMALWMDNWFQQHKTQGFIILKCHWRYSEQWRNSTLGVSFKNWITLENPMDRGAWWATVHGVAKSRTRLSDFTFPFHFPALEKEMATHSSVLGESQGRRSLVGCRLWGCTESDTTEVT